MNITVEIFIVEINFRSINWEGNHRTVYFYTFNTARKYFGRKLPKNNPNSFKNHQKIAFFNKTQMLKFF